jgi:hypothetical protein
MTLNEAIQNRRLIDVDLFPAYELTYTGVCLKANRHLWLIVNFNKKKMRFEGYTVLRNKDISTFTIWKKKGMEIKNNNLAEFAEKFSTKKINTFYSCLKKLLNNGLVAFFVNNDIKSYYIGKIHSLTHNSVIVKLVDTKGNWKRNKTFKMANIIYFSFQTQYEIEISKKLNQ